MRVRWDPEPADPASKQSTYPGQKTKGILAVLRYLGSRGGRDAARLVVPQWAVRRGWFSTVWVASQVHNTSPYTVTRLASSNTRRIQLSTRGWWIAARDKVEHIYGYASCIEPLHDPAPAPGRNPFNIFPPHQERQREQQPPEQPQQDGAAQQPQQPEQQEDQQPPYISQACAGCPSCDGPQQPQQNWATQQPQQPEQQEEQQLPYFSRARSGNGLKTVYFPSCRGPEQPPEELQEEQRQLYISLAHAGPDQIAQASSSSHLARTAHSSWQRPIQYHESARAGASTAATSLVGSRAAAPPWRCASSTRQRPPALASAAIDDRPARAASSGTTSSAQRNMDRNMRRIHRGKHGRSCSDRNRRHRRSRSRSRSQKGRSKKQKQHKDDTKRRKKRKRSTRKQRAETES